MFTHINKLILTTFFGSQLQQMAQEKYKLEQHVLSLENDKIKLLRMVEDLHVQIKADRTEKLSKEVEGLLKQMVRLLYQCFKNLN